MRIVAVSLCLSVVLLTAAELDVQSAGYPRAFFFRGVEGLAANPKTPYEAWASNASRLMGIMGKCLDEEVLGRGMRNPEFFTRFKNEFPAQAVLLHYNGNARDPLFEPHNYFPGHWIYQTAVRITRDVPEQTEDTVISIENASGFETNMGLHRNKNDDIALFGIAADGKTHDWAYCEQVVLVAKDHRKNTITVRRGQYGTTPRAFKAGRSRAAAHATEGPWGAKNNLLWFYNYTPQCPRDAEGKTASDRLVDDIARWFSPKGILAGLDGLEFDVLFSRTKGDTDGDGVEDDGIIDGINTYGIGTYHFLEFLRARMGDAFIIQADGALGDGGTHSQRGCSLINGIESEGWPDLRDNKIEDWSGGMNRQFFWQSRARKPVFNYINHKFTVPAGAPGDTKNADVPFSTHRLVFAAACFFDAALTFAYTPERETGEMIGVWDEVRQGRDGRIGWLGKPLGPAVRLAERSPDLLNAAMDAFASRIRTSGRVAVTKEGIRISAESNDVSFTIADIPAEGSELFLSFTASAETMQGYPAAYPRALWMRLGGPLGMSLMQNITAGMCERGNAESPIDAESGAQCRYIPAFEAAGEKHAAYFTHPPYKKSAGQVFWERDAAVQEGNILEFYSAMGPKSAAKSDGVIFQVSVMLNDTRTNILTHVQKEHRWIRHRIPLAAWTGKTIRIRFTADCGPNDNAVSDQAYWGDAGVTDGSDHRSADVSYMSWADTSAFTSGFYFRNAEGTSTAVTVTVEGKEAVTIHRMSAHAHTDALYRMFENGIVLANPAEHPYEFDLSAIAPGNEYRKLAASSKQDTVMNDGSPVRGVVTLSARDAIFLLRTR